MKARFLVLIALLIATQALAKDKEETIFGDKIYHNGGFGALVSRFTTIDGSFDMITGVRGGWIVNHKFSIGAGFYDNALNQNKADWTDPEANASPVLEVDYSGVEFEYTFNSNDVWHYSAYMLIGGGDVRFKLEENIDDYDPDYGEDWFFVLEPAVNGEVNVASWFRVSLGLGYRFVAGADYSFQNKSYGDSELSGPYGVINFKFGAF